MSTSVIGISAALDQPSLLELVEQTDQLAAVVAERVGDRTLRLARALVEHERGSRSGTGAGPVSS